MKDFLKILERFIPFIIVIGGSILGIDLSKVCNEVQVIQHVTKSIQQTQLSHEHKQEAYND